MRILIRMFLALGVFLLFVLSFIFTENEVIVIILLILGLIHFIFSSKLGSWRYESVSKQLKSASETLNVEKQNLWFLSDPLDRNTYSVWLIRVFGLLAIGYSIFRLVL